VSVTPSPDRSVTVKLLGVPGRTYRVQWSFDLRYRSFLLNTQASATGNIEFTDHTADSSRRFYRIVYP